MQKMDNKDIKKINYYRYILPAIWGICILTGLTYYKINYGIQLMQSDTASDILYAHLLSSERSLISDNWIFSTELIIFDNKLLFALLFQLFPQLGWWEIETIGSVIMWIIMGLVNVWLAHELRLGYKSLWMFGFSLLPYGISEYYYVLMQGCGYYIITSIKVVTILSLFLFIINHTNENKIKLSISYICFWGLSFLIGVQGMRLLANLYAPLLLSSLALCWYEFYSDKKNFDMKDLILYVKKNRMLLSAFSGTCMAVIGYAVNFLILAKKYTWQATHLQWKNLLIEPVIIFLEEVLTNLGYVKGENLFSFGGFANLFSLVIFVLVLFSLIAGCRKAGIFRKDRFIICFFIMASLLHLFIYVFLQKKYKDRYMLPFIMLLPPIILLVTENWKKGIRKTVILIIAVSSIITSINVVHYWHLRGNHQDINISKQQEMADFLVNNGYEYGFATFWYCNSTIQLSNGKLDICPLKSTAKFEKYQWLCTKEEIDYKWSDKIFFIVSDEQLKEGKEMAWNQKDKIIWHDGGIYVFGYDSVADLQNAFTNKKAKEG